MAWIHLEDWPRPVHAGRRSILEATLDAGVPFPHGCRSGECGSCKCMLVKGEVRAEPCSPDALNDDERAQGLILACRSRPLGDVYVRLLAAPQALPVRKPDTIEARVAQIERASHDVVLLTLALPDTAAFEFGAGQYAQLRFGKLPARNYSMANTPREQQLTFHVRVVPGGAVSPHIATQARVGDAVTLHGPFGDAVWREPDDAALLLLAGGTGLAPMLSVLGAALHGGHAAARIHLFHGVRTEADLYAGERLRQRARDSGFAFTTVIAATQDGADASSSLRGMHLHEAVAQRFDAWHGARVFAAGPPPMVDAVKALALARGTAPDRIHTDAFFAAPPRKRSLWQRITGAMPLAA